MMNLDLRFTRRSALVAAMASLLPAGKLVAADQTVITVHKDPTCGCCSGWVRHLQQAGFATNVVETRDLDPVKRRLGVPTTWRPATRPRCRATWSKGTYRPAR